MAFNEKIFWAEDFEEGPAQGGIFIRAFQIVEFLTCCEEKGIEVVGLKFDGNNLEVIVTGRGDE